MRWNPPTRSPHHFSRRRGKSSPLFRNRGSPSQARTRARCRPARSAMAPTRRRRQASSYATPRVSEGRTAAAEDRCSQARPGGKRRQHRFVKWDSLNRRCATTLVATAACRAALAPRAARSNIEEWMKDGQGPLSQNGDGGVSPFLHRCGRACPCKHWRPHVESPGDSPHRALGSH